MRGQFYPWVDSDQPAQSAQTSTMAQTLLLSINFCMPRTNYLMFALVVKSERQMRIAKAFMTFR